MHRGKIQVNNDFTIYKNNFLIVKTMIIRTFLLGHLIQFYANNATNLHHLTSFLSLLWSPCVIRQTIIFLPCDFYLSSSSFFFFPGLISAAVDWMSTILPDMVWP